MLNPIRRHYCPDSEDAAIVAILEDALYEKSSYFFQRYTHRIEQIKEKTKDFTCLLKILSALSDGYDRKPEIASLSFCGAQKLNSKLTFLQDTNLIEKNGNLYRIKDNLFSFWFKHVFQFNYWPFIADSHARREAFRASVNEMLALFREDFFKDKIKRVTDLVFLFKDDTVTLGDHKITLPSVNRAKNIFYPHRNINFLIGEGKDIIFMGVKENIVDDADVINFIERGYFIRGKNIKKIFISLNQASPTARLIAKENRLILWDQNELNHLLRLYHKPIMIDENSCTI